MASTALLQRSLTVGIVGGSVSAGHDTPGPTFAYPARLVQLLQPTLAPLNVTLTLLDTSVGNTMSQPTIACLDSRLPLRNPAAPAHPTPPLSLLLWEFAMNDAGIGTRGSSTVADYELLVRRISRQGRWRVAVPTVFVEWGGKRIACGEEANASATLDSLGSRVYPDLLSGGGTIQRLATEYAAHGVRPLSGAACLSPFVSLNCSSGVHFDNMNTGWHPSPRGHALIATMLARELGQALALAGTSIRRFILGGADEALVRKLAGLDLNDRPTLSEADALPHPVTPGCANLAGCTDATDEPTCHTSFSPAQPGAQLQDLAEREVETGWPLTLAAVQAADKSTAFVRYAKNCLAATSAADGWIHLNVTVGPNARGVVALCTPCCTGLRDPAHPEWLWTWVDERVVVRWDGKPLHVPALVSPNDHRKWALSEDTFTDRPSGIQAALGGLCDFVGQPPWDVCGRVEDQCVTLSLAANPGIHRASVFLNITDNPSHRGAKKSICLAHLIVA